MALPDDGVVRDSFFVNIRKLAALDIAFHSPRFILWEFGLGVVLPAVLGALQLYFSIVHFHALVPFLFGVWLLSLAFNYLPLLLYAIDLVRHRSAQQEVAFELANKDRYAGKYTRQSLLLVLPLVVPILALVQEMRRQR